MIQPTPFSVTEPQLEYKLPAQSSTEVVQLFWNKIPIGQAKITKSWLLHPLTSYEKPSSLKEADKPQGELPFYFNSEDLKKAKQVAQTYQRLVLLGTMNDSNQLKTGVQDLLKDSPGFDMNLLMETENSTQTKFSDEKIEVAYRNLGIIGDIIQKAISLNDRQLLSDSSLDHLLFRLNREKMKMIGLIALKPLTTTDFSKITINPGFAHSKSATKTEASMYETSEQNRMEIIKGAIDKISSSKLLEEKEKQEAIGALIAPNADLKQLGCIDTARASQLGYAFVSDGTGHGKPGMRPLFQKIFSLFEERLTKQWNKFQPTTLEESRKLLISEIKKLNQAIENISSAATLSFVLLLKGHNQKLYALTAQLGDSNLFVISPKNQSVEQITQTRQDELGGGGGEFDIKEIQPGDKIIGITDGITDYLSSQQIKEVFFQNTNPLALLSELHAKILKNEGIKPFDAKNPHSSDDISCFVLQY